MILNILNCTVDNSYGCQMKPMRWTISQGKCPELNNLWPHPLSLFLKTRGTKCPGPGFRQTMEINPSNSRSALDASREDIMTLWWALNCKLHVRYIKYLSTRSFYVYLFKCVCTRIYIISIALVDDGRRSESGQTVPGVGGIGQVQPGHSRGQYCDQTCGCLMSVIQSPDMKAMFEDLTLIVLQYQYTQGQQNLYQ